MSSNVSLILCGPPVQHSFYNFAFSSTVPICSFAPYFFNTPSLWYFQNCFVASLPATRFKIFAPPGCSSTKSGVYG